MKHKSNPFLFASLAIFAVSLPVTAYAVTKANNSNNLNLGSSWTGGVAPDGTNTASAGVAQFDTSITGTGAVSYTLGGNVTWGMIRVDRATATAGSLITITGANTITLNGNTSVGGAGRPDAILLNSATGSPLQIDSNIILGGTNGTTEYFTASRGLTLNGTVDLSGVNLNAFTAGGTSTYNGVLFNTEGTSNLVKSGSGSLVLANANTYNGTTTIENGTLSLTGSITSAGNVILGSGSNGTLSVGSVGTLTTTGTLSLGSGNTGNVFTVNAGGTVNAGIVNNAWGTDVTVNGTLNVTNGYTVATNATKSIAGSGTINAASLSLGNAATTVNFTSTGTMNLTGLMTFVAGNSPTFNQSAGTVNTAGLALNGTTSTYTLTGGRINIGSSGITGTGTTRNINLGAGTIGARADWSSTLAMGLTNAAIGTTFNTLDSVDNTTARTISLSGVLSGSGQLIKSGAGTLTLTGTNTYTGATNINTGKLVVNGNISTSSMTTVKNTGILGGSGTVGALTAMSGGTVSPGNSPGILSAGNTDLQLGSTLSLELGGTSAGVDYDRLNVTGTVTLAGLLNLAITGTYANNDLLFLLVNDGGDAISGAFSNYAEGANFTLGGQDWSLTYLANNTGLNTGTFTGGNDVALMAVPEPAAALFGGLGMLCLLRRRRA